VRKCVRSPRVGTGHGSAPDCAGAGAQFPDSLRKEGYLNQALIASCEDAIASSPPPPKHARALRRATRSSLPQSSAMTQVTEVRPETFTKYVETIEDWLDECGGRPLWFRGAGKSAYQLVPGLYRHAKKRTAAEFASLEKETMIRFRQRSIPFSGRPLSDDAWEMLFFMQHYRVPTRLLDWSENPFIAFYFAVMSAPFRTKSRDRLSFSDDAAVWVLDPDQWNKHALSHQSYDRGILVTTDQELKGYHPARPFNEMNNHPVALYGAHNSPRIVAQRGVFTIFGQNLEPMEDAYSSAQFPKNSLRKIVLKSGIIEKLRKSVLAYGITESVVYPDLEGLALEMRRVFGFEA
jgi:hypothetical protein